MVPLNKRNGHALSWMHHTWRQTSFLKRKTAGVQCPPTRMQVSVTNVSYSISQLSFSSTIAEKQQTYWTTENAKIAVCVIAARQAIAAPADSRVVWYVRQLRLRR